MSKEDGFDQRWLLRQLPGGHDTTMNELQKLQKNLIKQMLLLAAEYGFKSHEQGNNLEKTLYDFKKECDYFR